MESEDAPRLFELEWLPVAVVDRRGAMRWSKRDREWQPAETAALVVDALLHGVELSAQDFPKAFPGVPLPSVEDIDRLPPRARPSP